MTAVVSWVGGVKDGAIHSPISTETRSVTATSAKTAVAPHGAGFAIIRATANIIVNVGPEPTVVAATTSGMNMQSGEHRIIAIRPGWAVSARTQ
jgi:hypothetical protein